MTRHQKSKGTKRPRGWHRGGEQDELWRQVEDTWPDLGTGADPTQPTPPKPLRKVRRKNRQHGDSL